MLLKRKMLIVVKYNELKYMNCSNMQRMYIFPKLIASMTVISVFKPNKMQRADPALLDYVLIKMDWSY